MFTQPVRQIVMMLFVTGLVLAGGYLVFPAVEGVFLANPWLNGFIGMVFLFGVGSCFWQVIQLSISVSWIEHFVAQRAGHEITAAPRLLAPLAALLRSRGAKMQISSSSSRSILDSVATRIDEARDITRYITNLLIFLGLLGTFYGLATTVPALVETIRSLAPKEGETGVQVFGKLMGGLEAQLGGMGTAFSSSLLGLAGSLVVGLLELFAGHGQNRFYRELEEWLSSITRLGFASGDGDSGGPDQSVLAAVLDQMVVLLDAQQARALADREQIGEGFEALALAMTQLIERDDVGTNTATALTRIAEGQDRIIDAQDRMVAAQDRLTTALALPDGGAHVDAESRMRLRSIDVQLLRLLEEMTAGRQESTADLRADLGALIASVRQLARGAR
ncbi:MAG: biopolymer transporter ExbB [Gemmobacter sp.]|nr:biopolymer transporter ExbB [Gemmobacter sp.]